jgi:AcrR family transcriptional regulator
MLGATVITYEGPICYASGLPGRVFTNTEGVRVLTDDANGRANQKKRTRAAIVEACREIVRSGAPVTMPAVAKSALVSEATAYRYFPDLVSLVDEALVGMLPDAAEALTPVADSGDPVRRVAFACEVLSRRVFDYEGAVRSMISASITRPETAATRPGIRFGLIDQALSPPDSTPAVTDPDELAQLKCDLAAVVSAEALFSLVDVCGLGPEEAIASLVRIATAVTEAALRRDRTPCSP